MKSFALSSDHLKTLQGVGFIFALRILQKSMGLASTYFLVRFFTKEEFGEYNFIISVVGVVAIFALSGLSNSVMQSVARGFLGTYRRAIPLAFFCSFIGTALMVGFIAWGYGAGQDPQILWGGLIAAFLLPFSLGLKLWQGLKIGEEKFGGFFKLEGAALAAIHSLIIVLCVTEYASIPLIIMVYFGVPALQNIIITILHLRQVKGEEKVEGESLVYGAKTSFYTAFFTISEHVDKLLLFTFLSPVALATYVAADRISELLRNLIQDLAGALAPRFAKTETYSKKLDKVIKVFCLGFGLAIIVFAFTLMPFLLILIFGEDYRDAVPIAQGLICAAAIGNLATLQFRFIRSKLDTESFRNITVLTSIFRVIISFALIPFLGLLGAVLSVIIYRVMMALTVHTIMKKNYLSA